MKRIRCLTLFAVIAASTAIGCGHYYGRGYRVPPPPPPPQAYYRNHGRPPSPGHVWAEGYWDLRGNNWRWSEGRWARPPRRNAVWVSGSWYDDGGRYRFRKGHWR